MPCRPGQPVFVLASETSQTFAGYEPCECWGMLRFSPCELSFRQAYSIRGEHELVNGPSLCAKSTVFICVLDLPKK